MSYVNDELTTAGQHLARSLGERMVVIASTFRGGTLWPHRAIPGGPPGHTEAFVEDIGPLDEPNSLDTLLGSAGVPLGLLDLRTVPTTGPVAERFAEVTSIMTGPTRSQSTPSPRSTPSST